MFDKLWDLYSSVLCYRFCVPRCNYKLDIGYLKIELYLFLMRLLISFEWNNVVINMEVEE